MQSATEEKSNHDSRRPQEIYKLLISNLPNNDLKTSRLVSHSWNEFATPYLFQNCAFSPVAENIALLRELVDSNLGRHVQRLYLDATAFARAMSPTHYADYMSQWFAKLLHIKKPSAGPLCQENLLYVLRSDPLASLTIDHLQGPARAAFASGYALYSARSEAQQTWIAGDQLFIPLEYIMARLPKLKHIETVTGWGSVPNREDHFKQWLKQNLPGETYQRIGLQEGPDQTLPPQPYTGVFQTPGVAARLPHPMAIAPSRALRPFHHKIGPLVTAALRALGSCQVKLESLKLPDSDQIGDLPDPWQRRGTVPITGLVSAPDPMLATSHDLIDTCKENLLLLAFKSLRALDLQMDHNRFGFGAFFERPGELFNLAKAILSMKRVETIAIGMQAQAHDPMVLGAYRLDVGSLFFEKSLNDAEGEEGADVAAPLPGPQPVLNNLFGYLAQAFEVEATNPSSAPSAPGLTSHTNPVPELAGPYTQIPPSTAGFQPQVSLSVDNVTGTEAMDVWFADPQTGLGGDHGPWHNPDAAAAAETRIPMINDDPLTSNPWPKLRSLALWNMPAAKSDVVRLIKTVKDSLKDLTLINVYYTQPIRHPMTSILASDIFGNHASSPHAIAQLQAMPQHSPQSASVISSGPGGTNEYHASQPSTPQSNLASHEATTEDADEQWYATTDILSDSLHLKHCDIRLSSEDAEKLRNKLASQIEGFLETQFTIDQFVTEYVLSGDGVGFAVAVAETIRLEKERK